MKLLSMNKMTKRLWLGLILQLLPLLITAFFVVPPPPLSPAARTSLCANADKTKEAEDEEVLVGGDYYLLEGNNNKNHDFDYDSTTHNTNNRHLLCCLTRDDFIQHCFSLGVVATASSQLQAASATTTTAQIDKKWVLDLKFQPRGGALVVAVWLQKDSFRYYAVLDTGSPFLTAPPIAMDFCSSYDNDNISSRKQFFASPSSPTTTTTSQEQYGDSISAMEWRICHPGVRLGSNRNDNTRPLQLGIVSNQRDDSSTTTTTNIEDDSGFLFAGLMYRDDVRQSLLQQLGIGNFIIDYPNQQLTFYPEQFTNKMDSDLFTSDLLSPSFESLSTATTRVTPLDMYNLLPFGPNLHHYALLCRQVSFTIRADDGDRKRTERIIITNESSRRHCGRDIVLVVDTGLTGCILDETWRHEYPQLFDEQKGKRKNSSMGMPMGATIELENGLLLQSRNEYWFPSCFALPWWYDFPISASTRTGTTNNNNSGSDDSSSRADNLRKEEKITKHPLVIALGATFLTGLSKIGIDNTKKQIWLIPNEEREQRRPL